MIDNIRLLVSKWNKGKATFEELEELKMYLDFLLL